MTAEATINEIVRLSVEQSGPMPDESAHRHYLSTLPTKLLNQRLAWLLEDQFKGYRRRGEVSFWQANRGESPAVETIYG